MSLITYAEREMELAWPKDQCDEMQEWVKKDVLELMNIFSKQGHSGSSAPYVLRIFNRLAGFKPIGPLTGEDDEWNEISEGTEQNKRYSAVFRKNHDNSTAYNIEGKVFIDEDGFSYTCSESRIPVVFPYEVPEKPEYVRVSEKTGRTEE